MVRLKINTRHTFTILLRHAKKLTNGTTVTATLRRPDLTESSEPVTEIVRPGRYLYDVIPDAFGTWRLTVQSVGAVAAQESFFFLVY